MAQRIDDSHQPFKRKRSIGPGPRKRPKVNEAKDWECTRAKPTAKHYVQVCRWVGGGGSRAVKKVKIKKTWKKRYNAQYRAWAARKRTPAKGPVKTYRCRRKTNVSCR